MSNALFYLNKNALEKALENVEYKKLHTAFTNAIRQSLELIRTETKAELGRKVPALARYGDTIVAEVAMNAEEGRVKIIKGKDPNYKFSETEPYWKLHFFEKGTKPRKRKTDGYHYEASSNGIGARKHRNRGASTGKITPQNFLSTAFAKSKDDAYRKLDELVNKSINEAFNK